MTKYFHFFLNFLSDCENAYGDDYCDFHKHLCQDPTDMAEMKEGCAKTCGVCGKHILIYFS